MSGAGGSGLYYVDTAGKTMFQMNGTNNFIGSLKTVGGMVGGGQAQMIPFACDPTMLCMAVALANIDKKLDTIKEIQQEMMGFLIRKEKSELKGNLKFLYDVFNNYKYNWDAVQDQFKDYQLALYMLAFSSFLDVMLLGNYNKEYLSGISAKLDDYSIKYKELYTQCYEEIFEYSSSSVESSIQKKISKTTSAVGKFAEKIPVIEKTQIDETLIARGDKLDDKVTEKVHGQMKQLIEQQGNFVRPFIDNIDAINRLNNDPVQLVVDKDNLYIATIS